MPARRLIVTLLIAAIPILSRAQTGTALRLTKTQGSSEHCAIHCALQDKAGNLWFGTTGEGVYRYDGAAFTQYTEKDGLSHNKVWCMAEDQAGNIWIGTDGGACLWNGKAIARVSVPIASTLATPSAPNAIWSLLADRAGRLWLGTSNGVYTTQDGKTFSRFLGHKLSIIGQGGIFNPNRLILKDVQCMLEDRKGDIWFGSGPMGAEGLCRFDGRAITSQKPGGETWIRYILQDSSGRYWIGTRRQGIWHSDGDRFVRFKANSAIGEANNDIGLTAFADRSGSVWFGGGEAAKTVKGTGGLYRYDGKTLIPFTQKEGLGEYSIWSMLEDRAGNIWVGTRNTGLYRFDGKTFTRFSE